MALILVVDEDERNREVLVSYLARAGHRVATAARSLEALSATEELAPDMVILDVLMPDLDGFEATRRLKRQTEGRYMPVILVTALDDVESRVAGYRAGADEYLPKPVYRAELITRVSNLLALREERLAVEKSHAELVELQRYKENFTQLLVHDLKNPLSVLAANVEYVRQELRGDQRRELLDALDDSVAACARLHRMVANLLDVGRFEEGRLDMALGLLELRPMLQSLVRSHGRAAQERQVSLALECGDLALEADSGVMSRVLENLIETAVRLSRRDGTVWIRASGVEDHVLLRVESRSAPLLPELREQLFEKYGAAELGAPRVSRGLGLYFCRLAVEAHGGRIYVEDIDDLVSFVLELPTAAAPRALHPG